MAEITIEFTKEEVEKYFLKGLETEKPSMLKDAGITKPDVTNGGSGVIRITQKASK